MVKDGQYITIQGWMVTRLHLKGGELIAYAIIFAASQDMSSGCAMSIPYLMEWIGAESENTARAILRKLVENKFVTAEEQPGKATIYRCVPLGQIPLQNLRGSKIEGVRARVTPAIITTYDNNNILNDKKEGEEECAHTRTCMEAVPTTSSFQEWWDLYSGKQYHDEYVTCERLWNTYTPEERATVMEHTKWFAIHNATKPSKKHPKWYLLDKVWLGERPVEEIKLLSGMEADTAKRNGQEVWQCRLPDGTCGFATIDTIEQHQLQKLWIF